MKQLKSDSRRPWQVKGSKWKLVSTGGEYSSDPAAWQFLNLRHVNGIVVIINVGIYGEDSGMRVYRDDDKPVTKSDIDKVSKLLSMRGLWREPTTSKKSMIV